MECELCGRDSQLIKAEIEGTLLSVCPACSRLGRIAEIKIEMNEKQNIPVSIGESTINPDFARLVKNSRVGLGLSIEQLGKRINETAAVLERVERGMRPTDELAKKLEKALKIKMLNYQEE